MIGKITGELSEIDVNIGLIETKQGLAYEVLLTPALLSKHNPGETVSVYTHFQVRDDAHILFGFETKGEKELFRNLISISGVGPKTGFSIISFSNEQDLYAAVRGNDVEYFSKVPGLGKKTAMKIILELSQRLKADFELGKMYLSDEDKTVIDALIALGYKSKEAKQALSKIPKELTTVEEKIRYALKQTSPTV